MHSRATDRRSASKCQGKWPDQAVDEGLGLPEVLVAVSTSRLSCKRAGKTRTLMPVWDSSGESRIEPCWLGGATGRALALHARLRAPPRYILGALSSAWIDGAGLLESDPSTQARRSARGGPGGG